MSSDAMKVLGSNTNFTFQWVPSHIGLRRVETVYLRQSIKVAIIALPVSNLQKAY